MLEVRRAADRFCTRTDWLTSWHSFSYGHWYDAGNVGFGPLVVSNHDRLEPGAGFDDHRHSGVDLVTFVVSGVLEHRDSDGQVGLLSAGQLQVLHAGSGVVHSECNGSDSEPVEYVQMWLRSTVLGSSYEQPTGPVVRLPAGELTVHDLAAGEGLTLPAGELVHAYLVSGELANTDNSDLLAGDALRLRDTAAELVARTHSRLLAWRLRKA